MDKPTKQRLVIFLDGTWNTEDDSTNVLNAYHNTREGEVPGKNSKGEEIVVIQKRYYDRGVGTTVSDNVRGGSYGMGLENNVREAYNWLVDNYNGDGENDEDGDDVNENNDEIYIFGFSRGAYTARSLVGLIGACGLVKRGAPITVTQLWNGYANISKNRDRDKVWWKAEMEKDENSNLFGRLSSYKHREPKNKEVKDKLYNKSEELLYNWSKRVDITYLGIYDTVGAMGIHALGIPGLKSKLDANHNLNPTTLIKRCRHALAIDEHRGSFRLTPILNFIRHEKKEKQYEYEEKILQRWFAGAHSNIGGGYSNNVLAMGPYKWIMDGANHKKKTQLVLIDRHEQISDIKAQVPKVSDIRDSFAELAGIVYPHIIRAKRNFRPIGRADVVRSGYTLSTINEDVSPLVLELLMNTKEQIETQKEKDKTKEKKAIYAPANLIAYLKKKHADKDADKDAGKVGNKVKEKIDDKIEDKIEANLVKSLVHQHKWPGEIMDNSGKKRSFWKISKPILLVIFWSLIAALGIIKMTQFFWGDTSDPNVYSLSVLACIFILVDWGEHKVTLKRNYYPKAIRLEAFWNILYWIRLLGILAFLIGFISFITNCINGESVFDFSIYGVFIYFKLLFLKLHQELFYYALASSSLLTIVLNFFGEQIDSTIADDSIPVDPQYLVSEEEETKLNWFYLGPTIAISLAIVIFVLWKYWSIILISEQPESIPSKLLLIFILVYASTKIFEWLGKPMGKSEANLGSIGPFQTILTKDGISKILNFWHTGLVRTWLSTDDEKELIKNGFEIKESEFENNKKIVAWYRLREILRKAIWRDIIGFVPLYSFIMAVILYIGSPLICSDGSPNSVGIKCLELYDFFPVWSFLLIATFLFDMLENLIELKHIEKHPTGGSHINWVRLGVVSTFLKFVGFFTAAFLCLAVIIYLCIINVTNSGNGWVWMLTTGIIYIGIIYSIRKYIYKKLF